MADRPDAYVRKNAGEVIRSSDWNELQIKAREEIRAHRHTGQEDGSLIPRAGIEPGAIDGKLIDPAAEVSVKTLTTTGSLNVKGDLAVNGKVLLGDIADLLATVKGLQADKLNRMGDTVSGNLSVQQNLLVGGRIGINCDDPAYSLDVRGNARLGRFMDADTDEWPIVVWHRNTEAGWDEGLIKHSSQRGFFGRSGIGVHIHENRDWGVWSSGWNSLLGVEGGTGNTRIKGRLEVGNSELYFTNVNHNHNGYYGNQTGYAAIENSANYAALMILGRNLGTPEALNRVVGLWDYLYVNGGLEVTTLLTVSSSSSPPVKSNEGIPAGVSGIRFANNPGGGACDTAWMQYYARSGEACTLEIGVSDNGDDHIALMPSGNVGIGTTQPAAKLTVIGTAMVTDGSGYAVLQNRMASGSLTIGGLASTYGGGSGWNSNTAALILETKANTEIAAHEGGIRVASLSYYEGGSTNRITIGRDMGWGSTSLKVTGKLELGNSDLYFTNVAHTHTAYGNAPGYAALENCASNGALMILGRSVGAQGGPVNRIVKLWDYLQVNGNLDVTQNLNVSGRINGSLDHLISMEGQFVLAMQGDRNLVIYDHGGHAVWNTQTALSDLTLKTNLAPIGNALDRLLSLRGITFEWKDPSLGTGRETGVIAQEVERVFPDLVETITERKFVSYFGLIPVLIEAIKEQQAQITELRNARATWRE